MATSRDRIVPDRRQERGIALAARCCRPVPERYFESTISAYFLRMTMPCPYILMHLDNTYLHLQNTKWPHKKQYSRRGGSTRSHLPPRLHCIAAAPTTLAS